MTIYNLKSQFQDKLRPLSNALVYKGVTANQVTVSSVLLSAATAYLIANINNQNTTNPDANDFAVTPSNFSTCGILQPISKADQQQLNLSQKTWFIMPLSLFIRMALNAIDGMMAREHGQASTLGAVLNEVGDIVSDELLISSIHSHNSINALSMSTEVIAIGSSMITGERANQGPLGKSDRAFVLGLIGVLAGCNLPLHKIIKPATVLIQLLLLKTNFNRLNFIAQRYFEISHPAPQLRLNQNRKSNLALLPTLKPYQIYNSQIPRDYKVKNKVKNNNNNIYINYHDSKDSPMTKNTFEPISENEQLNGSQNSKSIIAEQNCYNAYDGTAIFYRYWLTMPLEQIEELSASKQTVLNQANNSIPPVQATPTTPLRQVILLHRGHEHSGRLSEMGESFAKAGYQVFACDARGNGRSGGIKDHAESVTQLERDLDDFVKMVISKTGIAIEDTLIVASSIGAVLAAAWAHDYAPTLRGMILGTPAISIRLYIPFAIPALKSMRKLGLMSRVSSYVKAKVLTHDEQAQQAYNQDPLISSSISSDLLIDTHATGQRLLDDADAITIPTFVLCAGKDYVVDKQAERQFYENLASPIKYWQLYPDSFHAIFHETNKSDIFSDCIEFADQLFAKPLQKVDLKHAHLQSPSKDKVDRLAIKPFNPSFTLTRLAMQRFGHISDAIATGLEHGFDSGSSLDKVYKNKPDGKNLIGKAIDKFYLNNIGWQGIRIRRQHLIELASIAIEDLSTHTLQSENSSVIKSRLRLLDIASGNGYYAFDLLQKYPDLTAQLRDYDAHNVKVIIDKADKLQMSDRLLAVQKDAFDQNSYDSKPANLFDIAIASGVFELFSDNTLVNTAVSGIYDSLQQGGYFIYTNQPWHPEQEFISKTLNNHRGTDWVMRCRSQAEMDQLVIEAGFKKVDMRIDHFGIFTVSLARKP